MVTQMVIICISVFWSGGNRSGMLMLTIPLIRSDPHSDKGNTCRLAIQRLQFNVKRNKAQACKEKTYTTLQENITYATVGETTTTNTVTVLLLFFFIFIVFHVGYVMSTEPECTDEMVFRQARPTSPADTLYPTCFSIVHMGKNVYYSYLITTLFTPIRVALWVGKIFPRAHLLRLPILRGSMLSVCFPPPPS